MISNWVSKAVTLFVLALVYVLSSCNSHTRNDGGANKGSTITKTDTAITPAATASSTLSASKDSGNIAVFQRTLYFMNTSFNITATGKGSLQYLTIQPHGLSDNKMITIENTDPVVNAEVADLNNDGYAELLIYTQSAGSGSYGNVIAYSVNNGQSLSAVMFPKVISNGSIRKQYGGHDQFAVINNRLVQRFPSYNTGDVNSRPTGPRRTIIYKLVNEQGSRRFVIDKVTEE